MTAPLPNNEAARLNALHKYKILDTPAEEVFDDLTRLTAHMCGTPAAAISLIDADRQWFKSKVGIDAKETKRDVAFCTHAILQPDLFIVRDAYQDIRFVDNPLVTSDPKVRFYAGAPLITPDNFVLGTLSIIDYIPRDLTPEQQEALHLLARQVMRQLELRRNLAVLKKAILQRQQSEGALLQESQRCQRVEVTLQQAHGELEIRVEERTVELRKANEQLQTEIVERQRAEEEVRFLQTMTQAISESSDFHSALGVALRYVCEFTGWNFGEAWIPGPDDTTLKCSPAWYGSTQSLEKFRKLSEEFTFPLGTGLPGRVWSSRRPEWIQNVSSEPDTAFQRVWLAIAADFKAGLGVPIIARFTEDGEPEVLAVLVFFMFKSCEEDKRLVEIVSTVATQLSSLIQRKRVESALRESEERLKAILDNSTALIYVKDLQDRYILINRWYASLFHLDADKVIGKTNYDIFPTTNDVYRVNDQKVLEARTALAFEEVIPHDDGLHTYISIKFPLYDSAGVPYAICGISTDITERKQAEDALYKSLATNRALINALPDLMFRISKDGIFVNFKAAKEDNLLMPPSEFLGKHLYDVLPQEVAVPTMYCVKRALATGEIQIFEYQLLLNNNLHDYEARIVVSAEDEVMAIVRDITERKRAEEDIRNALEKEKELGELKSRFVTMTSHEFRTPLTTILSSAELLEDYGSKWTEEKKLQHLRRIQTSVNHMSQLLNDVLLIGKAEVGKLECNPVELSVAQFCRDLVDEMLLGTTSHTITFQQQGNCTNAYLDEKLLWHILSNLLSNAIKYSPVGGTVYFDLVCEQGEAIFRVQDEGIGIPKADQAQLFNSFHRASNVGTIPGTGLGLSIVKKAVDLHGGKITVESEVGVGTKFVVSLPLNKHLKIINEQDSSN